IASAEGASDRLPGLANELLHRGATVIAAAGTVAAREVMNATATIPIVFVTADDPIDNGLATRLNRPTRNATGVSMVSAELRPKMLELLLQAIPNLQSISVLANPNNASVDIQTGQTQAAAAKMGLRAEVLKAANPSDIDAAFASLSSKTGPSGVLVNSDPFFTGQRSQIVELAAKYAIPAIYPWREYVLEGGLMSYGSNNVDSYRVAGTYVGRILQGSRPEELPIWQPIKFELVLNLKTAKSLGITFPSGMVVIADDVIE
ncbi:MAG: ABC transporter substrate-binding protein, partial [Acidobacteriaceae bacterium]|nr:ABC transporter substrate-binding protein [Acidobacteriaceae bacterium]